MAYISNQWLDTRNGRSYSPRYVSLFPSYGNSEWGEKRGIKYSIVLKNYSYKYQCTNPDCESIEETYGPKTTNQTCSRFDLEELTCCDSELELVEKIDEKRHMVLNLDAGDIVYVFRDLIKKIEIDEVFDELIRNLDRFSAEQKLEIMKKILNDKQEED